MAFAPQDTPRERPHPLFDTAPAPCDRMIQIVTSNLTAWSAFFRLVAEKSAIRDPVLYLLQEHRLPASSLESVVGGRRLKQLRFQAALNAAILTDKGGVSSGVGVVSSQPLVSTSALPPACTLPLGERCIWRIWAGGGNSAAGTLFVSVYLYTGEGMGHRSSLPSGPAPGKHIEN